MRAHSRLLAGAKDMKSVLFNWTWSMGMLRSGSESELIKTLHYEGAGGTIQVNGQPCTLTKYQMDANYQLPGYRVQIACTRANKTTYTVVENMSGDYSWDDDIAGAELVPGKGKSTPRPETYEERRIRLWASPQGAPKAAIAAAAGLPPAESFGQNPATLLDRQAAAGAKSLATTGVAAGGKARAAERAVVTFPIPGRAGRDGESHARRQDVSALERRGDAWVEHDRVRLQQLAGLEQSAVQDRGAVCGHHGRAEERRGASHRDERRSPRSVRST